MAAKNTATTVRVLRVRLFGGFRLSYDQHPVHLPSGSQRLIAFLALRSPACRTEVAGSLWSEVSDARAHGSLRTSIWQVHRCCPGLLMTHGNELDFYDGVYIDAIDLQERAHRILREAQNVALAELTDGTIRQKLLPGWYDEWVLLECERFRQLQLYALEAAGEELLSRHKPGPALMAALDAVNVEPLRESAHRLVIRIHISEGNFCEAIRHYQQYLLLLGRELGVQPTRQLEQLVTGLSSAIPDGNWPG